jgi:hypothetical protein
VSINCAQTLPGVTQRFVLGVRIDARRDRGVGVPQPLRDDGQRHAPKVHRGPARVTGVVQPDRAHTGSLGFVPHPRQRVGGVRLPRLVNRRSTSLHLSPAISARRKPDRARYQRCPFRRSLSAARSTRRISSGCKCSSLDARAGLSSWRRPRCAHALGARCRRRGPRARRRPLIERPW